MLTVVVFIGFIVLVALAATDLWVGAMSSDELSQMGLEM